MISNMVAVTLLLVSTYNPNPWEEVHKDATVQVWARAVPDSKVREVKAQRILDVAVDRVWEVLKDVDSYREFMPYVVESRALPRDGEHAIEYFRISPPMVASRDYTLRVKEMHDPMQGIMERRWTIAPDSHGPPPREDAVRLQLCDGAWTLRRLAGGRTEVTYWLYTDPAGAVPGWLADRANSHSLPDLMHALHRRAVNPEWRR